jgi:asparagine synthetase B (glutamine-hydrolysing)
VSDGRTLHAWRDAIGFGSMAYRSQGGETYIASEPKQIVAGASMAREPDLEIVESIFYARMRDDRRCALRGVERLPPATMLVCDSRGHRLRRYWQPEDVLETLKIHPKDVRQAFEERMGRAVKRALRGDDAISLSGGVDSPAIAAFAAPLHAARTGHPLPSLTATYPDHPRVDETRYVQIIAESLGLAAQFYAARARATDDLGHWVGLLDGPVPVISIAETAEHLLQAQRRGIRNLLSGEFAEFVFDMRFDVVPHLLAAGRLRAAGRYMKEQHRQGTTLATLARRAVGAFTPSPLLALLRRSGWKHGSGKPDWIAAESMNKPKFVPARDRWREGQLGPLQANLSLEVDDVLENVCGVTQRQPWADRELWEFFLSLPAEIKFPGPGSKRLVRSLLEGRVPATILQRKDKTVFDSYIGSTIDYDALASWLGKDDYRMPGIDYAALRSRIEQRNFTILEYMWAKDLAGVHAFLSLC